MSGSYSIISVTKDGDQLTASGYHSEEAVEKHIQERVRMSLSRQYVEFIVVCTNEFNRTSTYKAAPNMVRAEEWLPLYAWGEGA